MISIAQAGPIGRQKRSVDRSPPEVQTPEFSRFYSQAQMPERTPLPGGKTRK
jgi:hypothetical protein